MADNLSGWRFKRGLDDDFMAKLELEAQGPGWFADVLADSELILGIRKNYLNVYRLGQSLFKIERDCRAGPLRFSTHPKYLVDPRLHKAVPFDGSAFMIDGIRPFIEKYERVKTLDLMKRAAELYSGAEKDGVHAVARANKDVIDTEVAFSREAEAEKGPFAPRIDLACLEEVGGSIRLRFWEAKLYTNKEIRADGDTAARVVGQVTGYRDLVEKHREDVVGSYRAVARNLADIARWGAPARKVGKLVEQVADGEPIEIDKPPMVGLIVYGYDDAQGKSARWKSHLGKLTPHMLVRCAGDAKNIKLRGADAD